MFAHLHKHSSFSFLDGLISPAEPVEAAVQAKMHALDMTDSNGVTGVSHFSAPSVSDRWKKHGQ